MRLDQKSTAGGAYGKIRWVMEGLEFNAKKYALYLRHNKRSWQSFEVEGGF